MDENKLQNFTKKERKQLRREERDMREEAHYRNRKMKRVITWGFWIVVMAAVMYGLVWTSRIPAREELGQSFTSQGQQHIAQGATHEPYNSNPPTSGPHYAEPANWGIYETELPDETLVHNLEHGGIWVSYNNVATDTVAKIEALAKQYPNKLIVEPRSKDDALIVLASWTRLLKLDQFDESTIVNFIKSNKNRSPEPDAQ